MTGFRLRRGTTHGAASPRAAPPRAASPPAAAEPVPDEVARAGRIVLPAAGASVGGVVRVAVEPAWTGRPVDLVRLEWRRGSSWTVATALDERTYEVEAPGGAALVRSEALAETVAALLGVQAVRSASRPWAAWRRVELPWETAAVLPGLIVLRAVTVDEDGVETASPELEIVVSAAPPADPDGEPEPAAADPPRRLRPQARRSRAVLEAAIDSHPKLSADRREALEALLAVLLDYAEPDGTLPARFDDLVDAELGDLLEGI